MRVSRGAVAAMVVAGPARGGGRVRRRRRLGRPDDDRGARHDRAAGDDRGSGDDGGRQRRGGGRGGPDLLREHLHRAATWTTARPPAGTGPQLAGAGLTEAQIREQVMNGGGAMPPGLATGQDLDNVTAYVLSLQ